MISLNNVQKIYHNKRGNVTALKNVTLNLPSTGLISIVGASGSGKTTLLNIISMLDKTTSVMVAYYGTNSTRTKSLLLNIISVIDQEDVFLNGLDVRDNVRFFSLIQGKRITDDEILQKMQKINLQDCFDKNIFELSTGQKQRVSFLRSVLKESDVLIADEPTGNLDDVTEQVIFTQLMEISKNQLVIAVTHNRVLATKVSDRVLEIRGGDVIYDAPTSTKEKEKLIIKDDCIYIENKLISDLSYWNLINALLLDKKHLKLYVSEAVVDVKDKNSKQSKPVLFSRSLFDFETIKLIAKNKLYLKWKSLFVEVFLSSMLMLTLFLVLSLVFFNKVNFIVETTIENQVPYTIFYYNPDPYDNFYRDIQDDLNQISLKSSGSFAGLTDYTYSVDSNSILTFYDTDEIYGYVIYDYDVELVYGNVPSVGEVLLTDYTANFLIKNGLYQDYKDIVDGNVIFDGLEVNVSGILLTDASDYLVLNSDEETIAFTTKSDYREEFLMNQEYIYSRIYIPYRNVEMVENLDTILMIQMLQKSI
jgi:ABC-type lipoprotein export system ATPase subunit